MDPRASWRREDPDVTGRYEVDSSSDPAEGLFVYMAIIDTVDHRSCISVQLHHFCFFHFHDQVLIVHIFSYYIIASSPTVLLQLDLGPI